MARTATAARARPRTRSVDLEPTEPVRPSYEGHAIQAFIANRQKNEATRVEKREKDLCFRDMLAAKVTTFRVPHGNMTLEALIAAPDKDEIDMAVLYDEMVTKAGRLDDFLAIVSTSQQAVKDKMGSVVLATCLKPKATEAALTIKEVK